jgi:hypothetical protein
MKKITALQHPLFKCEQPHFLKKEYELWTEGELVATLQFRSSAGSLATARSGDGCWTFKRVGYFHTGVTIRPCNSEADLAVFKRHAWKSGGILYFPDGRKLYITDNCWRNYIDFRTEAGNTLLRFKSDIFHRLSAEVEAASEAAGIEELPWLVLLSLYLAVLMHEEDQKAGGDEESRPCD